MTKGTERNFNYSCTKCGHEPANTSAILKGCPCGNGFFRIIARKTQEVVKDAIVPCSGFLVQQETQQQEKCDRAESIAQVEILNNGVFKIDLDALFKKESETPVIISANGVYKLLNPSKL